MTTAKKLAKTALGKKKTELYTSHKMVTLKSLLKLNLYF